jgi:hypothetical protein
MTVGGFVEVVATLQREELRGEDVTKNVCEPQEPPEEDRLVFAATLPLSVRSLVAIPISYLLGCLGSLALLLFRLLLHRALCVPFWEHAIRPR